MGRRRAISGGPKSEEAWDIFQGVEGQIAQPERRILPEDVRKDRRIPGGGSRLERSRGTNYKERPHALCQDGGLPPEAAAARTAGFLATGSRTGSFRGTNYRGSPSSLLSERRASSRGLPQGLPDSKEPGPVMGSFRGPNKKERRAPAPFARTAGFLQGPSAGTAGFPNGGSSLGYFR